MASSAPTSPVHICNLILDDLKQSPINSIDTPVTKTELIMARHYDQLRRLCLFAHPWKFAITRVQLTPDPSVTIPFGFLYAFNLPTDYLRLITIGDDAIGDIEYEYQIESNRLLTSFGTSAISGSITKNVRYMRDAIDVSKFSPGFIAYMVKRGAVELSPKFSLTNTAKQELKDDLRAIEIEAKAVNGQERRPQRIERSRLIARRRGFGHGTFASPNTVFP